MCKACGRLFTVREGINERFEPAVVCSDIVICISSWLRSVTRDWRSSRRGDGRGCISGPTYQWHFCEDEGIEMKGGRRISEKFGSNVHVNVTSFNRNVLLTGEVPSETVKKEIANLVTGVENVRNITNEIAVGEISSFMSRSNDALITSKVKGRFMDAGKFQINHVKVVTENGVVYLLGLVNRQEAQSAVDIASSTSGVNKVVKVFEYQG